MTSSDVEASATAPNAATVTATAPGAAPVTFALTAATAADRATYDAPSSPWRIARGAGLVLAGAG